MIFCGAYIVKVSRLEKHEHEHEHEHAHELYASEWGLTGQLVGITKGAIAAFGTVEPSASQKQGGRPNSHSAR